MKIKKSQLKELIKNAIIEASADAKKAKKMGLKSKGFGNWVDPSSGERFTTKGGKLHKVDAPPEKGGEKEKPKPKVTKIKSDPFSDKKDKLPFDPDPPKDEPEMDAGGPSYANVPKGAKTSKDARGMKKAQDLAKSAIPDKTKTIDNLNKQAEKGNGDLIDTEYHGMVTWENGDPDEEDSFMAIDQEGEMVEIDYSDIIRFHNDDENDSKLKNVQGDGGEEKPIDREKLVGKQDDVARSMGAKHTADIIKRGTADKLQDFTDAIDDKGQDHNKINKAIEALRNNPKDMGIRKQIFDLTTLKESKGRRCTVKEIKKWMKGLEENRYKKTYNSDARRVSWMVNNNLSEDYDTMPVSMQKKWPKAAYKRERFLAKEFVKHLRTKELSEQKLRKVIRKIIKEAIRHTDARFLYIPKKDIKKSIKLLKMNIMRGQVEVEKKPSSKVRGFYRLTTTKKLFDEVVTWLAEDGIGVKTISKGKI